MKVAIIGAGINGLTVAVNILETIPNAIVTIYTENVSPDTTGDIAAGLWKPASVSDRDPRFRNWLVVSYEYLRNLIATDPNHHKYGLFYQDVFELNESDPMQMNVYHEIVENSRFMNERELQRFPNTKYGIASTSIMVQTGMFLSYLFDKFVNLGGRIKIEKVENFDEIQSLEDFPLVINCSGLGSRKLCNDPNIYPIRGQVIRVYAPWIKYVIFKNGNYIIPQSDGVVVLGGTRQKDNWSLTPNDEDTEHILNGCSKLLIGLQNPSILKTQVGLRPGATDIRVESEKRKNNKTGIEYTIIHNYGHGGSGFTLFWGCSQDVVQMASDVLAQKNV